MLRVQRDAIKEQRATDLQWGGELHLERQITRWVRRDVAIPWRRGGAGILQAQGRVDRTPLSSSRRGGSA
jgi:hypothetical protein